MCSVSVSSLQEKESAEELNAEARRKMEDYKVPDVSQLVAVLLIITESGMYTDLCVSVHVCQVMEYVREKASLHELSKTVKAWERKVEIAEVWSYV